MDTTLGFGEEVDELREAFANGGVEECRDLLQRKRDEWRNLPFNVAVIGNSGAGKSSFINAIRGLTADDEGAAEVDVTETTEGSHSYAHPNNPLLKFWDLPGVGTDQFPKATYLDDIEVDRFDFFLLITATRFTENDTWLGKEFREKEKEYFFIRTKVEMDISSNIKAHPRAHDEQVVVERIRKSAENYLKQNECEEVPLFLIDSYDQEKFQFKELEEKLIEEFPELKRSALIRTLQATSEELVRMRVSELRSRMWKCAALSGVAAAIPVSGLEIAVDVKVVWRETDIYFTQLGLDDASLKLYSKLTNASYRELSSALNRGTLAEDLSFRAAVYASTYAWIEEGSKLIPLIGPFIASPLSCAGTYYTLKLLLGKMEDVALEVMKFSAKMED